MFGSGPPVVFSPGLLGLASWRFYLAFIDELKPNLTVAVLPGPISVTDVERVADAIGAQEVGFLSHSALDAKRAREPSGATLGRLRSDRSAVVQARRPSRAPDPRSARQSAVLDNVLPQFNQVRVSGEGVAREAYDAGHADLLDDTWAELAARSRLWSSVDGDPPQVSYEEWSSKDARKKRDGRGQRREYRTALASRVTDFSSSDWRIIDHHLLAASRERMLGARDPEEGPRPLT